MFTGKKLTKQTNKTVTRLAKRYFKMQLKNILIQLKFSEGKNNLVNWVTTLESLQKFQKKAEYTLISWKETIGKIFYFPLISLSIDFFLNIPFL